MILILKFNNLKMDRQEVDAVEEAQEVLIDIRDAHEDIREAHEDIREAHEDIRDAHEDIRENVRIQAPANTHPLRYFCTCVFVILGISLFIYIYLRKTRELN